MPKQSRGFWTCDFCSATYDTFEDATFHETCDCTGRPQPAPQHQGLYTGPLDAPHRPASESAGFQPASSYQTTPTPYGFRRFLFMGQNSGRVTRDDATACSNIEVFEVDVPNTTDPVGAPLALGTVGLRCIHCVGDRGAYGGNANFPRCVADLADCVREIAENHLWRCERTPDSVKQVLKAALATRQHAKQQQGQAWFEQENSRRLLIDYAAHMTRELGLVNKYPANSGIMFQPHDMPPQPPPVQQERSSPPPGVRRQYSPSASGPIPAGQPRAAPVPPPPAAAPATSPQRYMHELSELDQLPFGTPQFRSQSPKDEAEPLPLSSSFPSAARGAQDQLEQYDSMPVNFPFVCEQSGHWVCKFCQHVHPQYRDPQYQWAASNKLPPPAHFIDHHLSLCRMYQQSLLQDYQTPPAPSHNTTFQYPHPPNPSGHPGPDDFGQFPAFPSAVAQEDTPARDMTADTPVNRAMAHLDSKDLSITYLSGEPVPTRLQLALNDDRLLLTDYYFYLMKQLRHCRFTENDRRTRGGKRDAVPLGYGGLQCVHCANLPNARKFFWSSVDRLANSFAEIPTHILKCRACPQDVQDSLLTLKEKHADQMSRLPRGSQKVYFRRMWKRVHEDDPLPPEQPVAPTPTNSPPVAEQPRPERLEPFTTEKLSSAMYSPGTSGSEESVVLLERAPTEAARALADSAIQAGPPSPSSRVLLSIPNDKEWLSDNDIFIRQQVEVFCATKEDVDAARLQNKFPIEEGTVGIRCIHCALAKRGDTTQSTMYPFSVTGIYEAVGEFHKDHLKSCKHTPASVKAKLSSMKGLSSLSSVARNYYITAARSLGLVDTKSGIRASGEGVPLSSRAAFAFSDPGKMRASPPAVASPDAALTPRKRSHSEPSQQPEDRKRQAQPHAVGDPRERAASGDSNAPSVPAPDEQSPGAHDLKPPPGGPSTP